ncbi:hypothetical protein U5817_17190 [Aromatoleum evansii]|uniref:Uncharacterized protein n=1 Tax=Aromatoleum evansii TaxID=59406 RepID=A0ABZ1AKG9_AROEV|nr:hypothetical protein U5817_17190 [Aromatoleum evansii]
MNRLVKRFLVAAVLVGTPFIVVNGLTVFGNGPWSTPGVELLAIPVLFGLFGVLAAPLAALFKSMRRGALGVLAVCAGLVVGGLVGIGVGGSLRSYAFERAAERAVPLVAAVQAFVAQNGAPPEQLALLTPGYLQSFPEGVPPLEIVVGEKARERYLGNPWALVAKVPGGLLNWDTFIYLPNQEYPAEGLDGRPQRLGAWAYLHE